MPKTRETRLMAQAQAAEIDVVALVPGPNLFYISNLSFHLSERPVMALFKKDERAIVLPRFEAAKLSTDAGFKAFTYSDEAGYDAAFQQACQALGLTNTDGAITVGVETLQMRVLEAQILEQYIPQPHLVAAEAVLASLRMIKDPDEIALMRQAAEITDQALAATLEQTQAGVTEGELAAILQREMLDRGAEGMSFTPLVQVGSNSASPHATAGQRVLQPGDVLLIDCGARVGGYCADITRTFALGRLDEELAHIHEIVCHANAAGRAEARPGVAAQAVDRAARDVIEAAGYGEFFTHRTGHGIGLEDHEPPYIVAGNERTLEPGMTFTVEPGIYLPGRGGVRVEDDVVVTETGTESLTAFSRGLILL